MYVPSGGDAVRIRPCTAADVEAVLDLWRAAGSVPSATDDPSVLRELLVRDADALLVAEVGGRLVGSLIAAWDGWRGHMYRLAVLDGFRRRGIATALVAEGEQTLRAKGARRITALVLEAEKGATAFWKAAGYTHDRRIARFVRTIG